MQRETTPCPRCHGHGGHEEADDCERYWSECRGCAGAGEVCAECREAECVCSLCVHCGEREGEVVHYIDPREEPGTQRECALCEDAKQCEACDRRVYWEHGHGNHEAWCCYACDRPAYGPESHVDWISAATERREGEAA